MMTNDEVLEEFRAAGACSRGISSCPRVCTARCSCRRCSSSRIRRAPSACAARWPRRRRAAFGHDRHRRLAGASGGIVPGYETARQLGAKAIFVEREGGVFRLRRGFEIPPGARVLMVEDIVTTGLSSREMLGAHRRASGNVVGAACLIDRSGGKADIGVPLRRRSHRSTFRPMHPTRCRPSWPRFRR